MPMIQTLFQPMMDIGQIKADAEEGRFRLKATGGGFFARLLGMGTKAVVTWDSHGFRLQKTTFGVEENTYIPRSKIASTVCITMKPVELLAIGLALLVALVGIIFLIAYFFSKRRVIIGVISSGGTVESVKLKVHPDTLEEIHDGMKILEKLIRDESAPTPAEEATESDESPRYAGRRATKPTPEASEPSVVACPSCGSRMSIPASAAGRRVRCTACREVFTAPEGE